MQGDIGAIKNALQEGGFTVKEGGTTEPKASCSKVGIICKETWEENVMGYNQYKSAEHIDGCNDPSEVTILVDRYDDGFGGYVKDMSTAVGKWTCNEETGRCEFEMEEDCKGRECIIDGDGGGKCMGCGYNGRDGACVDDEGEHLPECTEGDIKLYWDCEEGECVEHEIVCRGWERCSKKNQGLTCVFGCRELSDKICEEFGTDSQDKYTPKNGNCEDKISINYECDIEDAGWDYNGNKIYVNKFDPNKNPTGKCIEVRKECGGHESCWTAVLFAEGDETYSYCRLCKYEDGTPIETMGSPTETCETLLRNALRYQFGDSGWVDTCTIKVIYDEQVDYIDPITGVEYTPHLCGGCYKEQYTPPF